MHRFARSDTKFASLDEINNDQLGPIELYAQTKTAQILFTHALYEKIIKPSGDHIFVSAVHPGAVATDMQDQWRDAYGKLAGGAMEAVTLLFSRDVEQGSYSAMYVTLPAYLSPLRPVTERRSLPRPVATPPATPRSRRRAGTVTTSRTSRRRARRRPSPRRPSSVRTSGPSRRALSRTRPAPRASPSGTSRPEPPDRLGRRPRFGGGPVRSIFGSARPPAPRARDTRPSDRSL
jgi:hypothetical protein